MPCVFLHLSPFIANTDYDLSQHIAINSFPYIALPRMIAQ
jgi:hypothetical protein